jgi:hypothetical protein
MRKTKNYLPGQQFDSKSNYSLTLDPLKEETNPNDPIASQSKLQDSPQGNRKRYGLTSDRSKSNPYEREATTGSFFLELD